MLKRRKVALGAAVGADAEDSAVDVGGAGKRKNKNAARKSTALTTSTDTSQNETKIDLARYVLRSRVLVFCARGITDRGRHLVSDLRDLLPHSKREVKFDVKELSAVNEVAELNNCNGVLFLEARKRRDLYLWVSRCPLGPCVRFLVQNLHTMAEVKLTGNCLKGARPMLLFDSAFDDDTKPHWKLIKELLSATFGTPKGHPKSKPFIDHIFSFFIVDNRIWFRNYQIVYSTVAAPLPTPSASSDSSPSPSPSPSSSSSSSSGSGSGSAAPALVEIGPRFVLNPIKIFNSSFGGSLVWENPSYLSPNILRAQTAKRKSMKFVNRVLQRQESQKHSDETKKIPINEVENVFN